MQIESDGDVMCALSTFKEAGEEERHKRYRTIHVQECVQVMLEGDDRLEPLIPTQLSTYN